jgi:threonine/homoserine/homoserine lactone efflux protein
LAGRRYVGGVVSVGQVAAFALASLVLIVIPGPGVLFVIGRALAHGRGTALASAAGHAAGNAVVAVCVALGVGTVVERSAAVFTAIRLAGAVYLIWLGIQAFRRRGALAAVLAGAAGPRGTVRAAREGLIVGVTNPKAVILFAAVLPEFVDRAAGDIPAQMLILSAIAIVIGVTSDSCWALVSSTVRSWFAKSPRRLGLVGGAGGLAIIGLGLTVAITGRKD